MAQQPQPMMLTKHAQRQEDQAFIDESVLLGKITAEMADVWMSSMQLDRAGTRAVIHSRPSASSQIAEDPTYTNWDFH